MAKCPTPIALMSSTPPKPKQYTNINQMLFNRILLLISVFPRFVYFGRRLTGQVKNNLFFSQRHA